MDSELFPYVAVLSGIALTEAGNGFTKGNAHIVRDFLASVILIGMLLMNFHAARQAKQVRDHKFNFGYQRLSLMAAFVNTIYIMSKSLFSFLETIHHMIEEWEIDSHKSDAGHHHHHKLSDPVLEQMHLYHESEQHQAETKLYLSIFALLRLVTFLVYLLQGGHLESVLEYLYTNWLEMVKPVERASYKKHGSDLEGIATHSDQ